MAAVASVPQLLHKRCPVNLWPFLPLTLLPSPPPPSSLLLPFFPPPSPYFNAMFIPANRFCASSSSSSSGSISISDGGGSGRAARASTAGGAVARR